jgi:alkylation response protein AidB-like acyl-CoA dehydrogenase
MTDSEEQAALREVVRDFLGDHASPAKVRAGADPKTWARLAGELGLVGLAAPESGGGAGASLAEVFVVLDELGRVLLPSPFASCALIAAIVAECGAADDVLPGLADGSTVAAFVFDDNLRLDGDRVSGTARHVVDGPGADVFAVAIGDELLLVAAAATTVTATPTLDQTRNQATVRFDDAPVRLLGAHAQRARQLVQVGLAVESAGAADRALGLTVEYLKTRVQFGKIIGSFQALKHRCADLAVLVESARATAYHAGAVAQAGLGGDSSELGIVAPLAKLYCTDAFMQVAAEMIQLHGGIGFTWEHEAHLYFKRAKSNQLLMGTPSQLRRLVGQRAGILR